MALKTGTAQAGLLGVINRPKPFTASAIRASAGNDRKGAGGRVPAAKAERPLSVQSRDVRGDVGNGRDAPGTVIPG